MSDLELSREEREALTRQIQKILADELDQDVGNMEAAVVLDAVAKALGATFYNKGLKDAGAVFSRRADDIADELYALEKPVDTRG